MVGNQEQSSCQSSNGISALPQLLVMEQERFKPIKGKPDQRTNTEDHRCTDKEVEVEATNW